MTTHIKKIGLIQNAPLAGDFSTNLRAIVQGYRACIDHGADLVVAPAPALCGIEPRSLMNRRSFLRQMGAAMNALSHELGDTPLLLGGYARAFGEDELEKEYGLHENDYYDEETEPDPTVLMVPFLIEKDCVTELEDAAVTEIAGDRLFIATGDEELLPMDDDFDLLVHLPVAPWHTRAAAAARTNYEWEARSNGVPIVSCQAVGTAGQKLFCGGSCVYSAEGRELLRLPFFETAEKVVSLNSKKTAAPLPKEETLLRYALERGIRDTVRNNGYSGVCIPQDHPNAALLTALCTASLGSSNVCGISFGNNKHICETLHCDCLCYDSSELTGHAAGLIHREAATPALTARLQAAIMSTVAEERGLMLLSPLDRRDIMLGKFTLYGESNGFLAPLANLYEYDLYMLCCLLAEEQPELFGAIAEPERPEQDLIIHKLADCNVAAGSLIMGLNARFKENDVRLIQRQIIASELKRSQLPTILHVDSPEEQLLFPLSHRLND